MATTDWTILTHAEEGGTTNEARLNEIADVHDAILKGVAEDRDEDDSAGGGPAAASDGDIYIVGATPANDWSTFGSNDLAIMINSAWQNVTPVDGTTLWLADEDCYVRYDGTLAAWVAKEKVADTITASATQTQGQQPLDYGYSRISVCATTNDTVTLPACYAGARCWLVNDGAQTLQYFPASGDGIDAGSVDASATLAAAAKIQLFGMDATTWRTF